MTSDLSLLLSLQSEASWQRQVIDLAHHLGWRAVHVPKSKLLTRKGVRHVTHISPDAVGYFDPTLFKAHREVILAELKTESGRLTAEQKEWQELASKVPGVRAVVCRLKEEVNASDPEQTGQLYLHNSRVPLRQVDLSAGIPVPAAPCEGGHCWT
jgi:hypothetical protein